MQPLLEVVNLHRAFGGLKVHAGLDFAVTEGAIFAVIGPNGAGKTTLFQMISGLLPPDAGKKANSVRTWKEVSAMYRLGVPVGGRYSHT